MTNRHEAVAQFCERGTIQIGEAGRVAAFLAANNGRADGRASSTIVGQ